MMVLFIGIIYKYRYIFHDIHVKLVTNLMQIHIHLADNNFLIINYFYKANVY